VGHRRTGKVGTQWGRRPPGGWCGPPFFRLVLPTLATHRNLCRDVVISRDYNVPSLDTFQSILHR